MASDDSLLVDRIYEAGLVPSLWPGILGEMAARFEGVGTVLLASGPGGDQNCHSAGLDGVMRQFVEEGWPSRNQRLRRAVARRLDGFMTERDIFTDAELMADPMLTAFLLPRGLGSEFGTVIAIPSGDTFVVSVQKPFQTAAIPAAMLRQANALRPHLARSILFSARIGLDRARAAAEALQVVGLPAAVLRANGRPLAANALFEALVPAVAVERRTRIGLADPRADSLLLAALDRVADRRADSGTRSIPVRSAAGAAAAIAHLIPVRRSALDIFVGAASVLLLAPVAARKPVDARVLEALFDLTPAESQLCRVIGDGRLTLPETADTLGISYNTAKAHLRAVFDKTGTARQAELVGLLSAMLP
jgi:DNA-binding CsgD family transcriptional regulator